MPSTFNPNTGAPAVVRGHGIGKSLGKMSSVLGRAPTGKSMGKMSSVLGRRSIGKNIGGKRLGSHANALASSLGKAAAPPKKPKKPSRPGTQALRDIRKYQKSGELLLQKLPFQRCLRDVVQELNTHDWDYKFSQEAVGVFQEATEAFMVELYADAMYACIHRQRVTLHPYDISVARRLRHEID